MAKIVIELEEKEVMELEAIVLDRDKEQALEFLKKVIRARVREGKRGDLDISKGIGIGTK